MDISYDPTKNARNIAKHDLSFERARDFEFATSMVGVDDRHDYGEERLVAVGYLDQRLHVLCFVETGFRQFGSLVFAKRTEERRGNMAKPKPLIDADGEVRELTTADFKRMRPASEVLSPELLANWKKGGHTVTPVTDAAYEAGKRRGRPPKAVTKESVTLRLDPEVVKFFRVGGAGWQTRLNKFLATHVKRASKRATS